MAYTPKHFSHEERQVGDRKLHYLIKNEVLRESRDDYIEANNIADDDASKRQKLFLDQSFPDGYVLRESDDITTWVSRSETRPSNVPVWHPDIFSSPYFRAVSNWGDDHHLEVQIRVPAFKAYKILHREYRSGPMQLSRSDMPTSFFYCEDRTFNNLDFRRHGMRQVLSFAPRQSPTGREQSWVIEHYTEAEREALAERFNNAMRYRCQDYNDIMVSFLARPGFLSAEEFKMHFENAGFGRYLTKVIEEETALRIDRSDDSGNETMGDDDEASMYFDSDVDEDEIYDDNYNGEEALEDK